MCKEKDYARRELISQYLSEYRERNPHIRNWSRICSATGKSERTIHRYFSKEQTPNKTSFAEILEEIDIPSSEISDKLWEFYDVKYRPRGYDKDMVNSSSGFRQYSASNESLIIWAMASTKSGTTVEEISQHMHPAIAENLTNRFLESKILREINGRLRSEKLTTRRSDVLLHTATRSADLALAKDGIFKTGSLIKIEGFSKKGLKKLDELRHGFENDLYKLTEDPSNMGDCPTVLGLSLCKLGERDEEKN